MSNLTFNSQQPLFGQFEGKSPEHIQDPLSDKWKKTRSTSSAVETNDIAIYNSIESSPKLAYLDILFTSAFYISVPSIRRIEIR